jgi:divalent metal cation (Fe/Co/Zn/Cd) transporter
VVITGLVLVWIANMVELPILVKADALAAIGVAGIVIYVSLRLGKKTISDLLDAIPPGLREAIIQSIRQVPGIQSIERVRVRRSGPEFFADISLSVRRELALERAHDTATQVEIAINQIIPGADVVINMLPVATADEEITTQVRMLAARQGLSIHGIRIYDVLGKRSMELHLEVPDTLNLEQAHTKATDFETALKTAIPDLTEVITHIEPVGDAAVMRAGTPFDENQVKQVVLDITREMGAECHPHDLKVSRVDGEFAVSFHCVINGEQLITEAHKLTERFEAAMRARIPRLGRVTIHVEPPNAASL